SLVIVVRADSVLADVSATDAARVWLRHGISLVADPAGEPFGAPFAGVAVRYSAATVAAGAGSLQRLFYVAAIAMALVVLALGGYILWRDVQREVRIARMRAQFASSVSHELKTPLTSIRMFAETLREGTNDPRARGEYLDIIVGESERLTRLLDNVLDATHIEEGRKLYRLE